LDLGDLREILEILDVKEALADASPQISKSTLIFSYFMHSEPLEK